MTTTDQLTIVEQLVLQERKIVTYGWLSKYLKIHVNKAKRLLYDFYKASRENSVYVIYCICGFTANNNQHTVTLVTQEKLEDVRKDFTSLTSLHVYSVQLECPTEAMLFIARREPIDKITNEPTSIVKDASSATSTLTSQPNNVEEGPLNIPILPEKLNEKKAAKENFLSSEESTRDTMAIKNMPSKEKRQTDDNAFTIISLSNNANFQDESKASNNKDKKRKSDEAENNHSESKEEKMIKKSRKQIIGKQKSDNTSDINSFLVKAASKDDLKISNEKLKKRKSDEAVDELDIESEEENAANKQKNGKGTQNDSKSKVIKDKNIKRKKTNKVAYQGTEASKINLNDIANKDNKTEQKIANDLEVNNDKKDQSQIKLSATLDQQSVLPTVSQKKRGRRQMLKSRSYVNKKGYTVYENYHEWESFSEDESVSEPSRPQKAIIAKGPNATVKRGKKKGDEGLQKSLLSFFGRK